MGTQCQLTKLNVAAIDSMGLCSVHTVEISMQGLQCTSIFSFLHTYCATEELSAQRHAGQIGRWEEAEGTIISWHMQQYLFHQILCFPVWSCQLAHCLQIASVKRYLLLPNYTNIISGIRCHKPWYWPGIWMVMRSPPITCHEHPGWGAVYYWIQDIWGQNKSCCLPVLLAVETSAYLPLETECWIRDPWSDTASVFDSLNYAY